MVTLCFFLIFILLLTITIIFDLAIYRKSTLETLHMLLYAYVGVGRYFAYIGAGIGLISSIIIDYRLLKNNKMMKKNSQTDVS